MFCILFLVFLKPSNADLYKIYTPSPGLYSEHLGDVYIDRGIFRIKTHLEKKKILDGERTIDSMVETLEDMCKTSNIINCNSLSSQLKEEQERAKMISRALDLEVKKGSKRGLLGTVLTSVFGVNDEVYRDIDSLDENQKDLIKNSKHQTKLMLQTIASINSTEERINGHLNRFREALINGTREMSKGLSDVSYRADTLEKEYIRLKVEATYNRAMEYAKEYTNTYEKILNLHYNHGHFIDIIKPGQMECYKIPSTRSRYKKAVNNRYGRTK
uniref:Uncharacterized protein LOC114346165 n=1 Tax=Diabrotica virgifera virgifera TaxID=50390 RepID=A0A6P7GSF1_DIAVI